MSLTQAIDTAVDYVRAHSVQMTRNEMDAFYPLADRVYVLAVGAGLLGALPQVPELAPQLEAKDLPPVKFESKLNLPVDWDFAPLLDADGLPPAHSLSDEADDELGEYVFMVFASRRWFHDMAVLRTLAETEGTTGTKNEEKQSDDNEWILASEAQARLPFIKNLKALYKFAEDNPSKLRIRKHPKHQQRRQVNAADVLQLEMAHDNGQLKALGGPSADSLPSLSEGAKHMPPISDKGFSVLTKRFESIKARKQK